MRVCEICNERGRRVKLRSSGGETIDLCEVCLAALFNGPVVDIYGFEWKIERTGDQVRVIAAPKEASR